MKFLRNRNNQLIVLCGVIILTIYLVDLYKLNYSQTGWKSFGEVPFAIHHVQYFIADTPNSIGYREVDSGNMVFCTETVAFLESAGSETYRCCDTRQSISCVKGDFSSDIPAPDPECDRRMKTLFGAADAIPGAVEYQLFADCSGNESVLTAVQLDSAGQILWKSEKTNAIQLYTAVLRCVVAPLLLLIILRILFVMRQQKNAEPIPRLWKS